MTVRDLYERLQNLPLHRFDDEVFLFIPAVDANRIMFTVSKCSIVIVFIK